jgi:DNA-binding NarL/FixJ family response regulator
VSPSLPITQRQMEVAILVANGHTDKMIAAELTIAENTVGVHITNIAKALSLDPSLNTRVQITRRLIQHAA